MKKKLKQSISMAMASLLIGSTVSNIVPIINETQIYASEYTHDDLVVGEIPEGYMVFEHSFFSEGLIYALREEDNGVSFIYYGDYGFLDINGNEAIPFTYDNWYNSKFVNGLASIPDSSGKYGYIDKTGSEVISSIYDRANNFSDTSIGALALVCKDDKWGFINISGEEVIPCIYEYGKSFSVLGSKNLASVKKDDKWGFIDTNGTEVIPFIYDQVGTFTNDIVSVYKDDKWGFIDINGTEIIPCIYDNAFDFSEGLACVKKDDKWGFIDTNGDTIIPFKYDNHWQSFIDGIAILMTDNWNFVFIDKEGNETPLSDNYYISEEKLVGGLIGVHDDNDKFGYITAQNEVVIPFVYDYGYDFCDTYAIVVDDDDKQYILRHPYMTESSNSSESSVTTNEITETTPSVNTGEINASQTNSTVLINGQQIDFQAYNINGSNYFKLRDIAQVLKGTEKQFEVTWNNEKKSMELTSNKAYTTAGGELENTGIAPTNITSTISSMYLDGDAITLESYNVDGNNYFKLRDLGELFDFGIGWDGVEKVVTVDTSSNYSE